MKTTAILTLLASIAALTSANEYKLRSNPEEKGLFASVISGDYENYAEPSLIKDTIQRGSLAKGSAKAVGRPSGRDLKGSKGSKGSYSMPSGVCDSILAYYNKKDFKSKFQDIGAQAGGANADVPIYNAKTGKKIAEYTEISLAYGEKDCYVNGVWTFDNNPQGRPSAQIFTTSSCYSVADAVTGGIGPFQCAEGYAKRVNRGPRSRQFFDIYVCARSCQ